MEIIQATAAQLPEIKTFLNQNPLEHIHLDWGSVEQWVNKNNYLLQYNDNHEIIALLSCPPAEDQCTWIRQFSIKKFHKPSDAWQSLFPIALKNLSGENKPITIFSLSVWEWYERILKNAGFISYQEIVTLEWHNTSIRREIIHAPNTKIRQIVEDDIPMITALDHNAFNSPWKLPQETIINALLNSDYASVSLKDDKIVGYLISSQSGVNAHISRIAVSPDHQGRKLGQDLMENCMQYYIDKNIRSISVNTQKDNLASLNLYKKFGFEDLRDNFPVFQYSV